MYRLGRKHWMDTYIQPFSIIVMHATLRLFRIGIVCVDALKWISINLCTLSWAYTFQILRLARDSFALWTVIESIKWASKCVYMCVCALIIFGSNLVQFIRIPITWRWATRYSIPLFFNFWRTTISPIRAATATTTIYAKLSARMRHSSCDAM